MRRILQGIIVALAAFGLAAGSAIAQKAEPSKDAAKKSEAAAKDATKKAAAPAAAPAKAEPMDINSASEKELATLKGIGDVRAKAIVKNRPYKGKDELVQKKIVPQNVYDDIKEQIIAKQDAPKAEAKKEAPKAEAKKDAAPKKDEKKK